MSYNKSAAEKQRDFNELKERVKREVACSTVLGMVQVSPEKSEKGNLDWYKSPFREESTASFKVDNNTNCYIDFGESTQYHDVIELAMRLRDMGALSFNPKFSHLQPFSQAVLYLAEAGGLLSSRQEKAPVHMELKRPKNTNKPRPQEPKINILKVEPIKTSSLINYFVNDRKIDESIVKKMLSEVRYSFPKNPDKVFYSAGFANRSGGFELRSPPTKYNTKGFKGGSSPKDITLIKGTSPTRSIDLWEGFADMMTLCTIKGIDSPQNNTIVLNSTSLADRALDYLKNYQKRNGDLKKVYAYVDNDEAGEKTLHLLRYGAATEKEVLELTERGKKPTGLNDLGVEVVAQNERLYPNHNDLNALHTSIANTAKKQVEKEPSTEPKSSYGYN